MIKKLVLALTVTFAISGCGTTEIMKNIDGTYSVAAQYGSVNGSWDRATKDANEKAFLFCDGKGTRTQVIEERREGVWGISPQRAEVKFKCVSKVESTVSDAHSETLEVKLKKLKDLYRQELITKEQYDIQVEKVISEGR